MDDDGLRERKKLTEKTTTPDTVEITSAGGASLSPKDAYFELLRVWVHQANVCHNAMASFPYYLAANYPQLFQQQRGSTTDPFLGGGMGMVPGSPIVNQPQAQPQPDMLPQDRVRFQFFGNEAGMDNQQRSEEIINRNGGYEFIIAPLWKRFAAELVDAAILFVLKLIVTFTVMELFDLNLGIDFNFDSLKNSFDEDYTEILSITSDLLVLEIVTKVLVCIYEAVWTARGFNLGQIGGATPGKILIGIRIVYVEAVVALDPPPANLHNNTPIRALVFPAQNPGFARAFARAVAKNVLMALLFPICFVMLFFKNNRTGYDYMTKTVVVEENHAPLLRRR